MKHTKRKSNPKSKKKNWLRIIAIWALLISVVLIAVYNLKDSDTMNGAPEFTKHTEVTFYSSANPAIAKIDAEIANTEYDRQRGLMNREVMENHQGMLFIFPYEDFLSFWMKNTKISLDILFINSAKEIVTIHKNTTPMSEQSYRASNLSLYVVEVNAGFCESKGIKVGDRIAWE